MDINKKTFDKFDKLVTEYQFNTKEMARLKGEFGPVQDQIKQITSGDPDDSPGLDANLQILSRLRLRHELIPGKISQYEARNQQIETEIRTEVGSWKVPMATAANAFYEALLSRVREPLKPFCDSPLTPSRLAAECEKVRRVRDDSMAFNYYHVGSIGPGQIDALIEFGQAVGANFERFLAQKIA